MASILIAITGQTGIRNACLELGRRLREAGHDPHFCAPRTDLDAFAAAGLAFTELPTIELDGHESLVTLRAPGRPWYVPRRVHRWWLHRRVRGEEAALRTRADELTESTDFIALGRQLQPDLVLIDVELHEYILAAYGEGWPVAHLSQWYGIWRREGLPYQLTDARPEVGQAALDETWDRVSAQRQKMYAAIARRSYGSDRRSALLRLAERVGYPAEEFGPSYWPGPLAYRTWPTLLMAPWEMELPHAPRPGTHYVGPMVAEERVERDSVRDRERSLDNIIQRARGEGRKILVVTVSTLSGADVSFLGKLIAALREEPGWCMLFAYGRKMIPKEMTDLPENVHRFAYLPQLRALRTADLSINHGGIHTIHECLHFGVPMLVYSGKRSDQPGCAVRVAYHGVGVMADKDVDSVEDIRRKIAATLADGGIRGRIAEMQPKISRYRTERVLETRIEELLNGKG